MADQEMMESVATRMRAIRERQQALNNPPMRMSQVLARAEVDYSTWWRWERYSTGQKGGTVPSLRTLDRITRQLDHIEAEQRASA